MGKPTVARLVRGMTPRQLRRELAYQRQFAGHRGYDRALCQALASLIRSGGVPC